jgi:hypothetical protein
MSQQRGSARGMGVVWSTLSPKATTRPVNQEPTFNYEHLFNLWDVDKDQTLSVAEICWGLRNQTPNSTLQLPLLMFARVCRYFELFVQSGKNPDWHMYDYNEFKELLYTETVEEANDPGFIATYGNVEYLEQILPEKDMEQCNNPTKMDTLDETNQDNKKKKKKKKQKNKKKKKKKKKDRLVFGGKNVTTRLAKVFQDWDDNNDTVLSLLEIKTALAQPEGSNSLSAAERQNIVDYIVGLEARDENLDWHSLELEEFEELCSKHLLGGHDYK